MARRALVVAYAFPPNGVVGTLRTLRLVKALAAEGWRVTVLTGTVRSYPRGTRIEPALLEEVPASVTVTRSGAWRALARVCPVPDSDVGWLVPALLRGVTAGSADPPDVIYSSAPPWTGHLVAGALAHLWHRPWVADFRDPWARGPWRDGRPALARHAAARLERLVVSRADAVLFTTPRLRDHVVAHGPAGLAARSHVVPNGCDPAEFAGITAAPAECPFTLAHVGTLYGGRNPVPLLQGIAALRSRGDVDATSFRLRLIGPAALPGVDLAAAAAALGVADLVEIVPALSRRDSLAAMRAASALLLLQPGHPLSVPAKTFEYLAAGRPVLALTGDGATADVVRGSGCGVVVPPDDPRAIARALAELLRAHGRRRWPVDPRWYDARPHAAQTMSILDAVCGARARRVTERLA